MSLDNNRLSDLKTNTLSVLKEIDDFCIENGIDRNKITISAATKTVPTEVIAGLKPLGIDICGENRVQELLQKYGNVDTEWHFFGSLQTNKVKYIVDKITMLHSLDREQLAAELQRRLQQRDIPSLDVLIEVNIGAQQSKAGVSAQQAHKFYDAIKKYDRLRVRGIMSIPPIFDGSCEKYYLQLKQVYDTIKENCGDSNFNILSAGMSGDYLTAIKHGANFLRLGTVLFGSRQ